MLKEHTLFGDVDKVKIAIARLKLHEPPEGYYVAFSGGKDSCVVLDLCKRAGVKYDAHYSITTVDPPELVQFIKEKYPEAWTGREKPKYNMWQLIPLKHMPPTRTARYCCQYFKEGGGNGRFVVTGVRAKESARRAKRKPVEPCNRKKKGFIHPIFEWSEDEVWEYIRKYKVPYCSLYDEGFKRIGCIGCPYAGKKQRIIQFKRWPKYKKAYEKAFDRMLEKRKADGLEVKKWKTGKDIMEWWINENHKHRDDDPNIQLFGLMLDETDV